MGEYEKLIAEHDETLGIGPKSDAAAQKVFKSLNGTVASSILALVYEKLRCPSYDIESTLETFWANQIRNVIPTLEKIYCELVKQNFTEENQHNFNDLDDNVWFVPDPRGENRRIFIHTAQNTNFICHRHYVHQIPSTQNRIHISSYDDMLTRFWRQNYN